MEFRKIVLPTGTKIFLGKNAESNDELIEKFKGKENIILHTIKPGSPFCVIDKLKPTKEELHLSGTRCVLFSQDWRDNKSDVKVNVFTGKDVNKEKGMKVGTWHVAKSKTINIKKEDILKSENQIK